MPPKKEQEEPVVYNQKSSQAVSIAILGGAFDPPHLGHLAMATHALQARFCSEVWFMPSPDRWDKTMNLKEKDRNLLLKALLSDAPVELQKRLHTSDFEQKLGEFRGSLHLLRKLQEAHPKQNFGFLMGHDTLLKTHEWTDLATHQKTGKDFLNEIPCLIFERPPPTPHVAPNTGNSSTLQQEAGWNPLTRRAPSLGLVMPQTNSVDLDTLSSTLVREMVRRIWNETPSPSPQQWKALRAYVGSSVCSLIATKGYYHKKRLAK